MKQKKKSRRARSNQLRHGSKLIKEELMADMPYCDICGSPDNLELHHIYFIRYGFPTTYEHCVLLCRDCHRRFHQRFDRLLDEIYAQDHSANFLELYNELKMKL